jgi:tungstate transport system substrate-binding protein
MRRQLLAASAGIFFALSTLPAGAQEKFIVVASTTSTEQSGLFGYLLPLFEKETGIKVRVVALGTGQALDMARRGDADVVFVHDQPAEEKFLAEGFGVERFPVMYNDFVLIGPKSDPAKVAGVKDILEALRKVKDAQRSCRAATRAAPTRPSCGTGRRRRRPRCEEGDGYKDAGSGMVRRSTPRRR